MNPDKINELIPVVHEMFKKMGEWDGMATPSSMKDMRKNTNAYLAQKLDAITYHIVMAMRARSEGARICFKEDHEPITVTGYESGIRHTYEHHLAKSLLLTLDLMAFYGEPHVVTPILMDSSICAIEHLRDAVLAAASTADMTYNNSGIRNGVLSGIINRILRIAELDKIDLGWHISALINYMSQEVK